MSTLHKIIFKSLLLLEFLNNYYISHVTGERGGDQNRDSFMHGVFPPGLSWGYGSASYQVRYRTFKDAQGHNSSQL